MEPQTNLSPRVTVVIVDDDRSAREALRLLLENPEIEVIASCESPEECLDAIVLRPPHVALVDMRMQGDPYAGVTLISQIRALSPATACLALTASDRRGDLLPKAFYAGAHGYYRKGYVLGDELPRIILRLASGAWELDPEMAERLLRDAGHNAVPSPFTSHERDLLHRIASGASAGALAGAFHERESTIHTSIRNIMGKAQAARSAEIERLSLHHHGS
ncbi:MAG TPA: response regulator transcription factor [Ktedonobacterales bacterium]|jgi:DNA-binding NarL/FixJ family response regulator|nr:response regulator transcription factor [Ktedonobacterales bacterium]